MPVSFLTEQQRNRYGRFAGEPAPEQLTRYFHLDDRDRRLIGCHRGDHNRLGFAIQLCTARFLGTFLEDLSDVPAGVINCLARQLQIEQLSCFFHYSDSETRWDHAAEIRQHCGFCDFGEPAAQFRLNRWLYALCWTGTERPSVLFDRATTWLIAQKVLLPAVTTLERHVARLRSRVEERVWSMLAAAASLETRCKLEDLLAVPDGGHQSLLDRLRKGPYRRSAPELVRALDRVEEIRRLGIDVSVAQRIPTGRLHGLARFANTAKASVIRRLPESRRLATLVAFAGNLEASALDDALDLFSRELDQTYRTVAANLPSNPGARVEQVDGKDDLVVTPLDKLEEPDSLVRLREAVNARLPRVDLPEVLLEIAARTDFATKFSHVSERESRMQDLPTSLCANLIAEACNIGLEPLTRNDVPALRRARLSWVNQNFIRNETLVDANACLVAEQNKIPLVQQWGGGEVASADGLRFVVPVRTLHAGPNPKYFGFERGVTYYNLVSDQFTGLNAIVIPGTLRDSLYLLSVVLEQQTELHPTEIMTDTGAYTDVVFGLFWLLGYRFCPRIADIGGARYWRIDSSADYGVLNGVARHRINTKLIAEHWDDMLRLAGSLKLGTVQAAAVMKTLRIDDRPTKLAQAVAELGRIDKTIHALTFIADENKRRRILTQLNRGEDRHKLARAVFHGKRGELRQRYREGQEDQLGALGLVVNIIILWNTLYINAALEQLASDGYPVRPEDVARLSPLVFDHINLLGRYAFSVPDSVARGHLRPLRNPTDALEDVA